METDPFSRLPEGQMITDAGSPLIRLRVPFLTAVIILCLTLAVMADVYYHRDDGVYFLSNYQKTEQFEVAVTETTEEGTVSDVHLSFQPTAFETVLMKYCTRYGIDINLVKAVMMAESQMKHFNAEGEVITSNKGAVGIMQVMPATGEGMGFSNLQDMEENIHAGVKYLSMMMRRFHNNVILATAAYNAGPGAVERYDGIPPYPETRNYVSVVLRYYQNGVNESAPELTSNSGAPIKPLRQFRDEKGNVVLTNIY